MSTSPQVSRGSQDAVSPELSVFLDVVRFSAALVVFFSHIGSHALSDAFMWQCRAHSTEAVVIFFVLSGFVIRHVSATRETSVREYAISRLARLYSVVWLVVPVTLAADAIGTAAHPDLYVGWENPHTTVWDVLGCLLFLNQIWRLSLQIGSDGAYWSLGFEAWYYLLFGLALFLPRGWRMIGVAAAGAVAGPSILVAMPMWLLGVAGWTLVSRYGRRLSANRRYAALPLLLLPVPLYLMLQLYRGDVYYLYLPFEPNARAAWVFAYFYAVALLFLAQLLGFAAFADIFSGVMRRVRPIVRWLAGATFTLYLLHMPVVWCLAAISPWGAGDWRHRTLVIVGTLALILLLAEVGERRKRSWHHLLDAVFRFGGTAGGTRSASA